MKRPTKAQRETARAFAELQRRDQLRATPRLIQRTARKVLAGPPDKKEDAPSENGAPKTEKSDGNPICNQPLAQLPPTVGEIYDFALQLFAEKFNRLNRSPERFRESLMPFFLPLGTPRTDRRLLPERAFVDGALSALIPLTRTMQEIPRTEAQTGPNPKLTK